jgi:hypothetical protein
MEWWHVSGWSIAISAVEYQWVLFNGGSWRRCTLAGASIRRGGADGGHDEEEHDYDGDDYDGEHSIVMESIV